MKKIESAQEIVDNCDKRLTDKEIKEVESNVDKEIKKDTKDIVDKLK